MRLTFDTNTLPERDRIPFWHDTICQEIFRVTPAKPIDDGFRARLDVRSFGRFTFAELQTSHGAIEKTPGDLAQGASDSVMLYVAAEASQHSQRGHDDYVMARGDVCLVPMDKRFHCVAGNAQFRSLLIPQKVLGPLMAGGELTQTCFLPSDAPLGALLRDGLGAAALQLPHLSEEVGDAVLSNLSGLVALACGASNTGQETGKAALRVARLEVAKRHIARHLAEPGLDPASTATALRISVRQLHLLFEASGETFTQYVLQRRLEACRATLSSPHATGRSVADVAFGWGFNSLSAFYRAFGAAFGISPGALRQPDRNN